MKEALDLVEWTNGDVGRVLGGIVGGAGIGKAAKILEGPGGKSEAGDGNNPDGEHRSRTPHEQITVVKNLVSDDKGELIGVEGSKGVRMIPETKLAEIRQQLHQNLGPPTDVRHSEGERLEIWMIEKKPRMSVTFRTYSGSGGETIDFNGMAELNLKRFHIFGE